MSEGRDLKNLNLSVNEQIALLRSNLMRWNSWRILNPAITATLRGTDLRGVNLSGAILEKAHLYHANLSDTDLRGARLSGADLSKADLHNADLTGAELYGAVLEETCLDGANLSAAHLDGAHLINAHLEGANLSGAHLSRADLTFANLSGVDLTGANLARATLINTALDNATLDGCRVFGISVWQVRLDGARQANLRITSGGEPAIMVDDLRVAQFLYLLLNNQEIRAVLDTIASKVVLILGRFSAERKPALDALRVALREHPGGYIPVLFDFDQQFDKPVLETVKTLANLARFVVADLTDPNMVRSELTYITANVPTVPIRPLIEGDAALPTELETWARYQTFLPVYRYRDIQQLLAHLDAAIIYPVEQFVHPRPLVEPFS